MRAEKAEKALESQLYKGPVATWRSQSKTNTRETTLVKERLDGNKTVSKESEVGSDLEETFKNAVEKSRKVIESLEKSQTEVSKLKGPVTQRIKHHQSRGRAKQKDCF